MTDARYSTFSARFQNGGLSSRYVYDKLPTGRYLNLDNLESRSEGSLSTRYGLAALSTDGTNNFPLPTSVTTLGRMQGLSTPFNYAQAGVHLYRKNTDGIGSYGAAISAALSGNRMSMAPYRPNNNANPYMFLADQSVLLKDSGSVLNNWGIAPPTQPALIAPVAPGLLDIELFDEATTASFTIAAMSGAAMVGRAQGLINNAITTPGVQAAFTQSVNSVSTGAVRSGGVTTAHVTAHGFVTGMRVSAVANNPTDNSFAAGSAVITVVDVDHFTYPNPGPNQTAVNVIIFNPIASLQVGMSITTTDGNAETVYITEVLGPIGGALPGFIANFTKTHAAFTGFVSGYLSGTVAANTTATVTKSDILNLSFPSLQAAPDDNLVQLYVLATNPLAITQVTILFDVGDGTFTQDYYSKAVQMSVAQPLASGTIPATSVMPQAVSGRAGGGINFSSLGGDNPTLLPSDMPLLQQIQPTSLAPGANVWTLIQIPLSQFIANGAAGAANNDWSNVVAWRVQIQTEATTSTVIGIDDLVFVGGSDLNSFAGQPYDYRYTYIDINTGCESNPSQIMVATDQTTFNLVGVGVSTPVPLSVQQQAIQVTAIASPDLQVTHWNLYRRGGSLTQAWYFVAQIPIATLTYVDTIADSVIEVNNTLVVDADAPVTTQLLQPYASHITLGHSGLSTAGPGLVTVNFGSGTIYVGQTLTVGSGNTKEICYVQAVSGSTVTLYLQLNRNTDPTFPLSVPIAATARPSTPMNLMAIAFDKAWLAGDTNNPHVLYYSTTFQPETFPVENSLEIGTPDSPIMALIELQGLLFVFTTKRVYEILGAGSAVPTVIPTGVKHGLAAQFAWCVAEGTVYYLSYDGVYAFRGGQSTYMTEPVEWIWTGKNLGPVPAINIAQKAQIVLAYWNHEIFCRYVDQSGNSHRLISSETYGYRWRNDDQSTGNITAMYFAEDTGELFVGKDDGMVYQDRVNDFDSGGFSGGVQIKNPITYTLQSAQMDQSEVDPTYAKRNKLYNECTLDFDSGGQNVSVSLLFNGGAGVTNGTTLALGTFSQAGRGQVQININNGDGQEALNVGVLLTGSATSVVTFYECHLRAAPQGEFRKSMDSWWCGFGADEWHLYKQLFAEYKASDPAGILLQAFTDGNMAAPAFTLTLPQTVGTHRASKKFRFPATKCRLIRFIATSNSDFIWYDDSQWEHRKLGSGKGYERGKLSP